MNKETITILKDGKEVECEILFTFDSEDTMKSYVGYTDNKVDSNSKKNIYVSSYDPILGIGKLESITDDKEKQMIDEVLNSIRTNE